MLISATSLKGCHLEGLDGEIGSAREFYFDDRFWTVRYLVADTGGWFMGREVLISPYALVGVVPDTKQISVNLTKQQIQDSPSLDTDKPVSRQYEEDYYGCHGWPTYWSGTEMWGRFSGIMRDRDQWGPAVSGRWAWNPNLRSTQEVSGYDVEATDGEFGQVEDFIIDDETWSIRYLVVTTRHWLPGKRFLISPKWIESVNWADSNISISISGEDIKQSPEYNEQSLLTRLHEIDLHEHYNRRGYWGD